MSLLTSGTEARYLPFVVDLRHFHQNRTRPPRGGGIAIPLLAIVDGSKTPVGTCLFHLSVSSNPSIYVLCLDVNDNTENMSLAE
ncbi:hypothetical protein VTN96DRAFT_7863 [Rasamsonia emersonii]